MYINCPSCQKPLNVNWTTYCQDCFHNGLKAGVLFMPTASQQMHAAVYSVTIDKKASAPVVDEAEVAVPKRQLAILKPENIKKLGAALGLVLVISLILWRALPLLSPDDYVNKDQEVLINMVKAQSYVKSYHDKHKKYPKSLAEAMGPVVVLVNPFSKETGEGKAWYDYDSMPTTITPGVVVYQRKSAGFEIFGYGDKGIQLSKNEAPLIVNEKTDGSILK